MKINAGISCRHNPSELCFIPCDTHFGISALNAVVERIHHCCHAVSCFSQLGPVVPVCERDFKDLMHESLAAHDVQCV